MLNLPDGKTGQLYLADVLEQLETEITNKKHITNQPAKVSDAVEEIDRDVTKELVKYSRFMSSDSSLYRPCTLVVRYFSRKFFGQERKFSDKFGTVKNRTTWVLVRQSNN